MSAMYEECFEEWRKQYLFISPTWRKCYEKGYIQKSELMKKYEVLLPMNFPQKY